MRVFKAINVTERGQLTIVEKYAPSIKAHEVLIEVEACGVCGADLADIERAKSMGLKAVTPGHEVVGRIISKGVAVSEHWQVGQRVGVGRLGGACYECDICRQGHFNLCENQSVLGVTQDGGYAEMMVARSSGLVAIPDDLEAKTAAPILCAGIATFNALMKCGAKAGDTVAVIGIGGLGHLALQYARKMGFRVVAIGRGQDKKTDALNLGAHHYIDSIQSNVAHELEVIGGAHAIISTVLNPSSVTDAILGLKPHGTCVLLGVSIPPMSLSSRALIGAERQLIGSLTGSPYETEKALGFSVLTESLPEIQTLPFEQAHQAIELLKSGQARYRLVLTMKPGIYAS